MKLADLVRELSLEVKTYKQGLQNNVTEGYISDLLSDVMANSKKDNIIYRLLCKPTLTLLLLPA